MNIWPWSRIRELEKANFNLNRRLEQWEQSLGKEYNFMKGQAIAANKGMARLIAKLDPGYGRDELDPKVRAESDKLGDDIIRRLIGEHVASNRNNFNV